MKGYKLPQVAGEQEMMKENGRGLHIVRKHADQIYFNNSGNEIWALFSNSTGKTKRTVPEKKTVITTINLETDSSGEAPATRIYDA